MIDVYRSNDFIVLWIKTKESDVRLLQTFQARIFLDEKIPDFSEVTSHAKKLTYYGDMKEVHELKISRLSRFESTVRKIEQITHHRMNLYDADITPEQQYMYSKNLVPGCMIEFDTTIHNTQVRRVKQESHIALKKSNIEFNASKGAITQLNIDDKTFNGEEKEILEAFAEEFTRADPDVITMSYAFSKLPVLAKRLECHGIKCHFHRWDQKPIAPKGGKSFFSYGRVVYRDYAIRLNGRFLVDTASTVGGECDVDGIMELCRLTGARFQHVASRSFGAAFQHSLVRLLYRKGYLVPFKEKPVDIPLNMIELLKGDRAGHTFDAKTGFHKNVAEIDFSSMFPWIIYNKNISAETMLSEKEPLEKVPGLPLKVSHRTKGVVPLAVKPILDARMQYKNKPSTLNIKRAEALKWVLVTAYGYLRFREFKLGTATSHMAICAYARDIIIKSANLAEQRGFTVVHGIVDSLYIKLKNPENNERSNTEKMECKVKEFCKELEELVGIPVSFEGILKWAVFLPSVNDIARPLPATYYGTFTTGKIKARGIEVRQSKTPELVKAFQQKILEMMAESDTKKQIISRIKEFGYVLREFVKEMNSLPPELFVHNIRISTDNYKHNTAQKQIVDKLKKAQVQVMPGLNIEYIISKGGKPVLLHEYTGKPDVKYYQKLLVRALFILLQPLGISKNNIAGIERQTKLEEYTEVLKQNSFLQTYNQISI